MPFGGERCPATATIVIVMEVKIRYMYYYTVVPYQSTVIRSGTWYHEIVQAASERGVFLGNREALGARV